ncbi:hypothetical protein BV898_11388 [Hypsibius exemplaris]|uniref:Uncharacterized protein n=1 Tax=Hypsibius exemplaris TaxID=2072580 RepID=A0A1W0WGT6_HYPEX|nr:hypothetical protein BV898_11388 [Hypsibius exemplaris]
MLPIVRRILLIRWSMVSPEAPGSTLPLSLCSVLPSILGKQSLKASFLVEVQPGVIGDPGAQRSPAKLAVLTVAAVLLVSRSEWWRATRTWPCFDSL